MARALLIIFMVLALMPTVNAKEMHTHTHTDEFTDSYENVLFMRVDRQTRKAA